MRWRVMRGGQTPLHAAAWSIGYPDVLEALLAGGADLEARDEAGRTPVYGAITSDIINDVFAAEVEEGHIGTFTTLMGGPCCMDHPEGCLIMVFFNTGDNLDAT